MSASEMEELKKQLEKDKVEYVRLVCSNLEGLSVMNLYPARHIKKFGHFGHDISISPILHAGHRIPGFIQDMLGFGNDYKVMDPKSYTLVPYASDKAIIADVFYYLRNKGVVRIDPRDICNGVLDDILSKYGITPYSATEHEFCVLDTDDKGTESPGKLKWENAKLYASGLKLAQRTDWFIDLERALYQVGVDIESHHIEWAPSQLEFTIRPEYGIQGPDNTFRFRYVVRDLAQKAGFIARFATTAMPEFEHCYGSGAHLNISLWKTPGMGLDIGSIVESDDCKSETMTDSALISPLSGADTVAAAAAAAATPVNPRSSIPSKTDERINVFWDSKRENDYFSEFGRQFVAGVLKHACAVCALANPLENDYARIRRGGWSPAKADWGIDDRMRMIRVRTGPSPTNTLLEFRLPGGAGNPYLIMAAFMVAGMDGVRNKLECPLPGGVDSEADAKATLLPRTLAEALDALEKDTIFMDLFGRKYCEVYVRWKRDQIAETAERIAAGMSAAEADRYSTVHV